MEKETYDEFNAVEGKCKEGTCVCGTDLCNDGKEEDADAESGIDRSNPQYFMIILITFSLYHFLPINTIRWKDLLSMFIANANHTGDILWHD